MSSSRIGPPGAPIAPSAAPPAGQAPHEQVVAEAQSAGVTDRLAVSDLAKTAQALSEQPVGAALLPPVEEPAAERRARLGGDRGAWTARVRDGILFAANNPDVGHELLSAFGRGVA